MLDPEAKAQYLAVAGRFMKAGQFKKAVEVFPRFAPGAEQQRGGRTGE